MTHQYHPPEHQSVPSLTSEDRHHQERILPGTYRLLEAAEAVEVVVSPHNPRNLPPRLQDMRSHNILPHRRYQTHQYPGN